jgi:hypothetical protein
VSLAIDLDDVTAVLLSDGWHQVANSSFAIDAYEYVFQGDTTHGGGAGGITSSGYTFKEMDGTWLSGPLTAVLAVRTPDRG